MADGVIGSIAVNVVANTGKFITDMRKSARATQAFGTQVSSTMGTVKKAIAAGLSVLAVKALTSQFQAIANEIAGIADTSAKLGLTTEHLVGLRHAAQLTGVTVSTLEMALQRMTRRVAEAAKGTGEAKGALEELHLNAKKLNNLAPDKQFAMIARAMSGVEKQSDKVRLAMKLFDSEGVALVNTLALGEKGLRQMQKEAESLGATFSKEEAAKVSKFNDEVERLKKLLGGFKQAIVIDIAPAASEAIEGLRILLSQTSDKSLNSIRDSNAFGAKTIADGLRQFQSTLEEAFVRSQLKRGVATQQGPRGADEGLTSLSQAAQAAILNQAKQAEVDIAESSKEMREIFRDAKFREIGTVIDEAVRAFKTLNQSKQFDAQARLLINKTIAETIPKSIASAAVNVTRGLFRAGEKRQPDERGGINSLVRANTQEGFNALRRNIGRASDQIQRDQLKEQKEHTRLLGVIARKEAGALEEVGL